MADVTSRNAGFNLSSIQEPGLRRALRSVFDEMTATMNRQQMQIDALIEIVLDKHLTSMGELRRQLVRCQQEHTRSQRLHEALGLALNAPSQPVAMAEAPPISNDDDLPRRTVLQM
jgi:hypothetical protein